MQSKHIIALAVALVAAAFAHAEDITLRWRDNSTNERGFIIERAPAADGPFAPIGRVDADVATYVDTGLAPETTYWWRVYAYNADGPSATTNAASRTTRATPPAAPDSLESEGEPDYEPPTLEIPSGDSVTIHAGQPTTAAATERKTVTLPAGDRLLVAARQ